MTNHALKKNGAAVIEAALTLPIILYIMFFIIESIRMSDVQTAIDAIVTESTFDFIATRNTNNFEKIIKKHLPSHIKTDQIKYHFAIYKDLDTMCSQSPYGGESIYWPGSEATFIAHDETFIRKTGALNLSAIDKPETSFSKNKTDDYQTLKGKAFVLTFVCDYQFSSAFVAKIFSGGYNTKDKAKYLIWGRGVGVCN